MTIDITDNNPRISYTANANGAQTVFAVPFEFFDNSDLNVYVAGVLKSEGTGSANYGVSGGSGATGTVTFVSGVTASAIVTLTRSITIERTTDFTAGSDINRASLNTQLDLITGINADLEDDLTRSVRLNDADSAAATTLPLLDDRKGTVLGFNATTGAVEAGPKIAEVQSLQDVTTSIALLGTTDAVGDMNTLAAISGNITTAAGNSANVSTVAGISANVTTVAGISGNVTTVAGIASDISTVAADAYDIGRVSLYATEVNAVGDNIAAVDTVADNIGSVNYFFNRYKTGTTDPAYNAIAGTPAEGDLFYNTAQNKLKVYTGFSGNGGQGWLNGSAAGDGLLATSGGTMTGALGGLHRSESVTGTTPALNVGNNNFFDNGTLTATTSPTFTNVPTKARWQYSFNSGSGGAGFYIPDITEAGQDRAFAPIATVARPTSLGTGQIYAIRFSTDGDKIFFLYSNTDRIYEHALTVNWDITTIVATATTNYYYGGYESNAYDFCFSPDGLHMYVLGTGSDVLRHWTLTSPFSLSTLAYDDGKSVISNPYSFHISNDGMILFVMSSAEFVYKYNFGTEWDASSIGSYDYAESGPTSNGDTFVDTNAALGGFTITPDGLTMIAAGNTYERITYSALATPNVMSRGANLIRTPIPIPVLIDDANNYVMGFSRNGKYMWLSGNDQKTIALFDTSSPCQVTLPSSVAEGSPTLIKPNARTTMEFVTSNGGTNVNLIKVDVV
tara:strand:- start:24 stop:2222 length:2199 start_codon:yes stop_codon:yes gene_type:complete